MKKSELRQIIKEEIQNILNEKFDVNRQFVVNGKKYYVTHTEDDRFLHVIDDRKNRKTFDYKWLKKQGIDIDAKKVPKAPKPKKTSTWNAKTYQRWIKDMSGDGGARHAADMAQNAKYERGLLDYVKKKIKKDWGDETPLERIQWDIEAHA